MAPIDIRILKPDLVYKQGGVVMYNGVRIPNEELIYSRLPNPMSPEGTDGYSPVRGIAGIIQSYIGMRVAEFSTFRQSIINQILVKFTDSIPVEAQKMIKAELNRNLGVNNAGKSIGVGGVTGFDRVGLKPNEVVDSVMAENFRREILAAFGVPETILGIGIDSNRSQGDNDRYNFVENAIRPTLIQQQLFFNSDVFPMIFPGELIRAEAIIPLPDLVEEKRAQEKHDITLNIRTVNEVREERGLDPVPWGDEPIKPVSPIGLSTPPTQAQFTAEAFKEFVGDRRTKRQRRFDNAFSRLHARYEKPLVEGLVKIFDPIRNYLYSQMPLNHKGTEGDNTKKAAEAMAELYDAIAINGGGRDYAEAIARAFGLEFNFPKWRQAYAQFYADRGVEFWQERITSGRQRAMDAISEVAAGNISMSEGRARIEYEFGRVRAERIARTEITGAMNGGGVSVYKSNGIERKEWITTLDDLTRETHIQANGQIVTINDTFEVGGEELAHPGDPNGSPGEIVNCRCSVAPVMD